MFVYPPHGPTMKVITEVTNVVFYNKNLIFRIQLIIMNFIYMNPLHNSVPTPEAQAKGKVTTRGTYDDAFETVTTYGGTIFLK